MGVSLPAPHGLRVLRTAFVTTILFAGLLLPLSAQQGKTVLVEPPAPLLPESVGKLPMAGTPQTGTGVPPDAGEAAAVLKEDGVASWEDAHYGAATQAATADGKVRAYRFGDATGAYAAFTFLRKADAVALPAGIAPNGTVSGDELMLQSGVSVVVANLQLRGAMRDEALRGILQHLPKVGGRQGLPPLLPTFVPVRGLIAGSAEYALGPAGYSATQGVLPAEVIGFDKAAEAITAKYAGRSGPGVLTLLLYPTPQIAGDRGRAIESYLNSRTGTQASTTTVKLPGDGPLTQVATGSHQAGAGTVKLRREGPLVLLATGGFTPEQAQALIDGIHLRLDVTLDKPVPPEFHAEVRKTASLLVSIAVFSGVAGLAAVLLGLFLGFGRAWIRVLMGKPAAMEPEFLRLDLSGQKQAESKRTTGV